MKRINIIDLVVVAVCLLTTTLALGQGGNPPASTKESGATSGHGMTAAEQTGKEGGTVEEQITALSDQLIQAQLKDDTSFFEKYYADDSTIVHGNGKLYTKDQEIADLKSGSLKYQSVDVRDRKIRVYEGTAVVNFLISFTGTLAGQPFSNVELRRTVVWAKQKEGWKIVVYQVTRVSASK